MRRISERLTTVYCILVIATGALGQGDPDLVEGLGAARSTPAEGLSSADWASIRQAHEAHRRAAYPVAGGHRVRNPGQQWRTLFDGRGFSTEPEVGGWSWRLELIRFGVAGAESAVAVPQAVTTDGGRVVYVWDTTLEEWYVNDRRGLEHGYTVHQPPHGDDALPLSFILGVRGDLTPEIQAGGRGVTFVGEDGAATVFYTGLTVFDAEERHLAAGFECIAEGLRLTVDTRGARYPLTIDPVAQQAYLKASNTDGGDLFGLAVAVSGDTVVVGAPSESSNATGVDGD